MRCYCCNRMLSPYDMSLAFKESGALVDMCYTCRKDVLDDIPMVSDQIRTEHEDSVEDVLELELEFDSEADDFEE